MFEVGRIYNRQREIHEVYGGQRQGGISTPSEWPFIFLFTGESGEQYGYGDGWDENGVFLYTGEGQVGDMDFARGNRAIRDHAREGKDLYLFEALGKGKGYRHMGRFACSSWEFRRGIDRNGDERRVIVFHLIQPEGIVATPQELPPPTEETTSLEQLRERALHAASQAEDRDPQEAKKLYYQRSAAVRDYVLARAEGVCESCGSPAPFQRLDGSPYLEPHHTRRLSDGGPDHPRWVGALCPNCHTEIHHGVEGKEKNHRLQQRLSVLEAY